MEILALQVQNTHKVLQQPKSTWSDCCSSIEELAIAVESLGQLDDYKDVVRLLVGLSNGIGLQISALRSKLVKDVCEYLIRIVTVTGRDFQDMANALLPQIVGTSKNTLAAIRQPGAKLLSKVSEKVRYDLALLKRIYMDSVQERPRVLVLEQLRIVLVYWSDDEVLPWESDVLEIVRQGLDDQYSNVRKAARDVLCGFASRWSERVDEVLEMLSDQLKALLINERRDSLLAAAIMEKHPELVTKSKMLSRNRMSLAKPRSGFRSFLRDKCEQNIEIDVSATSPSQQRKEQEVLERKSSIEEMVMTSSTTAVAFEETESSACNDSFFPVTRSVARRLMGNPDFSSGSDDCQQDKTPTVLSRLQMHELHTKQEIAQPNALEIGEVSIRQADSHTETTVAGASSAFNAKEALLEHASIRQLKDPQISSLSTLPTSSYGEKHLGSPVSSKPRSSLLLRHESFSLNVQGNIGPSTPVGSAHDEETEVGPNSLAASDKYLSNLIPSSIDVPISLPPSTENVTLRSRQRMLARQGQDNSPVRPFSSALSAPQESMQPRSVDTTPELGVSSSQFNEEAVSPLSKQYADDVLDDDDDICQLPGGSDYDESEIERDHRRLDDNRSQSEGESRFVKDNDDQLKLREKDISSDKWHFDDETRHSCDSQSGAGGLMSGNSVGVVDDDETATANELEVSETVWRVKSSIEGHCPMQNETKEEADREKLSPEVKLESFSNDALTGLLNVRKEMTLLRSITNNEAGHGSLVVGKCNTPAQDVVETADIGEEVREQFSLKQDAQLCKEAKKAGQYTKRLTHADHLSRSPLQVPSIDVGWEQHKESSRCVRPSSPLKTLERSLYEATRRYDAYGRSEESTSLGLQGIRSPLRELEHSIEQIDESRLLGIARKDRADHTAIPSLNQQKDAQPQASFDASEQDGRFDAAEKLFAHKEVPLTQGFYNRPQSPEPERYMHSEPRQARFPPTKLGEKLNPFFVKAQHKVVAEEKIDAASEDVATEDVTTAADAEMQATSAEGHKEAKDGQPAASFDERNELPAPDCAERDTSTFTSDTDPRSTSKPPAVAKGMNTPPATLGWASSFAITILVFLAALFCMIGILRAAKKVQDSHEYHMALKTRIEKFEASITETHKKILKLEDDYALWSEYVRKLTEEDEVHALSQLEAIQVEVQQWQRDMNADLVAFQQALLMDSIEASFADLHVNSTKQM